MKILLFIFLGLSAIAATSCTKKIIPNISDNHYDTKEITTNLKSKNYILCAHCIHYLTQGVLK